MALKNLIKQQTIIIDDHKRGNKEIKNWDDSANDVHIHKQTNYKIDGIIQKVDIKIPINSNREITIKSKSKGFPEIPRKLMKEIHKAFEDKDTRTSFINDLVKHIKNFETILSDEARVREVLSNISNHFGLKWTNDKITTYTNDALTSYTQKYLDNEGNKYTIKVDKKQIRIQDIARNRTKNNNFNT